MAIDNEDVTMDDEDTTMDDKDATMDDRDATMGADETLSHEDDVLMNEDPNMTLVDDEVVLDVLDLDEWIEDASFDLGGDDDDEAYVESEDDGGSCPPGDQTEVPKAEWSEDMVQTEDMSRIGICVNTAAKVLICLKCASVIKPSKLFQHISKVHPLMSTTTTLSQQLIDAYSLHPDPLGSRPGTLITAIYGLNMVDGYISCNTCGYACKTEKTMKRHTRESKDCCSFRKRYVQTFQSSSNRTYFGVIFKPTEDPPEDPLDPLIYLKKNFTPSPFKDIPISSAQNPRDANHFLNLEKWDQYVAGKTGAELVRVVRGRELEFRGVVRTCVERFADKVVAKLAKVDNEPRAAMADYIG